MPIWEQEEKENKRYYYWFKLFLKSSYRSPTKYYRHLQETKPTLEYPLPKYNTFINYCARFNWMKRAKAYDEYNHVITLLEIQHIDTTNRKSEYVDLNHISQLLRNKIINTLSSDKSVIDSKDGFALQQTIGGLKTIIELKRLLSEQSTSNTNVTANVELDATVEENTETIFDRVDKELGITNEDR